MPLENNHCSCGCEWSTVEVYYSSPAHKYKYCLCCDTFDETGYLFGTNSHNEWGWIEVEK